jgi:hypothetical protein
MNCHQAIDVLADYLDGALTPDVLEQRVYLATYKRTAELAAKVNRVEMPPEVRRRLRDFLGALAKPAEPETNSDGGGCQ